MGIMHKSHGNFILNVATLICFISIYICSVNQRVSYKNYKTQ